MLKEVHSALRATDASAFTVLPRVLRRVIRHELDLPGLMTRIPYREVYVVSADHLRQIVSPDELSPDSGGTLPERVLLLSRPEEDDLVSMTEAGLLQRYWRLLFRARLQVALEERVEKGWLDAALIRQRIDHIGQVAFDEIDVVLRNESVLLEPGNRQKTYMEFVAIYWELRYFRPELLPVYFPSQRDLDRIDAVLKQDVDAPLLYQATRLPGAPALLKASEGRMQPASDDGADRISPADIPGGQAITEKARQLMLRRAERSSEHGNQVRSAIIQWQAARGAWPETATALKRGVSTELDRLARRLQEALGLDPSHATAWRSALEALLPHSAVGFWNANARLLYDLQKVCLAYERETYIVDVLTWAFTLGRRPLRRALPNQRVVLMSRYLRTAAGRLKNAELSAADRERLSELLSESMDAAESRLREQLRPVISQTLDEADLRPDNVPEEIAVRKIVEELLDGVVQRGFLTMGDLRDAVSRSQLKLSDLSGPGEMLLGDPLLRADRGLSVAVDGVYQRAPFYLRWLQRLSSLAFGTRPGRWAVLHLVLPFGGAYVLLVAGEHLVHVLQGREPEPPPSELQPLEIQELWSRLVLVACAGAILYGLMHAPRFREQVVRFLRALGRGLKRVFVDIPRQLSELTIVRQFFRSTPIVVFRRHLMNPALFTLMFCWALPSFRLYRYPTPTATASIWLLLTAALNSRAGRDIEEVAAERIERAWHRIRIHFFIALFDLIMDTFKQVLELVERVLYSVDEWLRFKSGESSLVFAAKAALGVVWTAATFVIRFCVTLLIEPQVNPIKHFPVVTVSHKIILPFSFPLARLLEPVMGGPMAGTVAGAIVLLLPGVFGFLVWELRGNWRLYESNRKPTLEPVVVGHHGETMIRLLKPGLHSGTVPKLYGKLRRAARQADPERRRQAEARVREKLHHVEEGLVRFFEREFLPMLSGSLAWEHIPVSLGRIEIGTNSVRVELPSPDSSHPAAWLTFAEQSGWVVAGSIEPGWIRDLPEEARGVFRTAILGLYQMAGVDLVREQIEQCFFPRVPPYDVSEHGIVVWPGDRYAVEALYSLEGKPMIAPQPQAVADGFQLPVLPGDRLIFGMSSIGWREWVAVWNGAREGRTGNGAMLPNVAVIVGA